MALDISGHDQETEVANVYGNIVVRRQYPDGRVLALKSKPRDFFNKSEADMMQYASDMGITAPQVLGCLNGADDRTIMVSHFVPGDTLLKVWPTLDDIQRASIKEQLKEQLAIMRKCKMPYIGGVNKQSIRNVFDLIRFAFAGPFGSEKEFDQWCYSQIKETSARWKLQASLAFEGHSKEFVLTHGDLFPQNIMVHNGKITGIIDWEYSGFFPAYFEYAFAVSQYGYDGQDWSRGVLEEVLQPCRKSRLEFVKALRAAGWHL